jgi:thiamine-phosphate pyrophosphorylase
LVTDRSWLQDRRLVEDVECALKAGVTFLQIREKDLSHGAFMKEAVQLKAIAEAYGVPFVVNDNVDIAIAVDADGVHIGQNDMAVVQAREKMGKDKILGVSVRSVEQAKYAEKIGADYLGVGAMFSTSTKLDAADVSYKALQDICQSVSIPVVAIGGINKDNITELKNSGIYGVAVISSILGQKDIKGATEDLAVKCRNLF